MRVLPVIAAIAMAASGFVSPASAAQFETSYTVHGSQAGTSRPYSGSVSVRQTSASTYQVVWFIAGQTFTGTGIGNTDGLAVAYKSGSQTGIAIYHQLPSGEVEGVWTYAGGTEVYDERWTPR